MEWLGADIPDRDSPWENASRRIWHHPREEDGKCIFLKNLPQEIDIIYLYIDKINFFGYKRDNK
jgi:hypothetical protein